MIVQPQSRRSRRAPAVARPAGQRGEFRFVETGVAARLEIERTTQFRCVILVGEARVSVMRIEAARVAQIPEPAVADQHMTDFVAQNHVENRRRRVIARLQQARADRRRGVEAARLERARHQRHAREHVAAGALAHIPQAVVRGKIAVGVAVIARGARSAARSDTPLRPRL